MGSAPGVGRAAGHHRNRRLVFVSLLTMIAVTGHYISFTFIAVIIRDVVGIRGPDIAWLLAIYGIAGLVAMPLVARPLDHHPRAAAISCMVALYVTLAGADCAGLPPLAGDGDGSGRRHRHRVVGLHSQTRCRRCCNLRRCAPAPTIPTARPGCTWRLFKWASWPGSFAGGLFYEHGVLTMFAASAALIGLGAAGMTADRQLFDVPAAERR